MKKKGNNIDCWYFINVSFHHCFVHNIWFFLIPIGIGIYGCSRPHIKFGIYRGGYYRSDGSLVPNDTSIIDFDDMKVKKLNP